MTAVETWIREMKENHMPHIATQLSSINHKLSSPRPPWSMTIILTILSSTVVGLLVALVKHG